MNGQSVTDFLNYYVEIVNRVFSGTDLSFLHRNGMEL